MRYETSESCCVIKWIPSSKNSCAQSLLSRMAPRHATSDDCEMLLVAQQTTHSICSKLTTYAIAELGDSFRSHNEAQA